MRLRAVLRTARATTAAGIAVLLVTSLGGWLLMLGPATGALGAEGARLDEARDRNRHLAERLRVLESQRDELDDVRAGSQQLAVHFPATADQPGFFALIDAAARRAGIAPRSITTLSPSAPVPVAATEQPAEAGQPPADATSTGAAAGGADATTAELAVQAVTLTVEATLTQTVTFVAALERMDRSLLVTSLSVSTDEDGTVVTTVTGSTFVAPPVLFPEEPGDGSPAATGPTQASR